MQGIDIMFLIPPETPKSFQKNMRELYKKCRNENKKIVLEMLPEIMNAGEAAWLVMSAKCKTVYLDSTQKEETESIYSDIGQKYYEGTEGIKESDFFAFDFNNQPHPNFLITKEALVKFINSDPDYSHVLASHKEKGLTPVDGSRSQRAEPLIRSTLKQWIKSLVENTSYDTYPKFKDLMVNTYFQKNIKDEIEKFNEGEKVRDVFCRLNEEKQYTVYFKIENELGNVGPLKHRALSTIKRIFDTVRKEIKSIKNPPSSGAS